MRHRLRLDRLRALVEASNISQNHWAMRLGLSRGHWSDLLNGRHQYVSGRTQERLLEVFGVSEADLFEDEAVATTPDDVAFRRAMATRFQFLEELGRGGMGSVQLAQDMHLHRLVAIKVMQPEAIAGVGAEPLLKELTHIAQLNHANILPLYDAGVEAGQPYLIMPAIADGSLRARLVAQTRIPLTDALDVLEGMARGIAHAHSRQILHCDIKPENVLLQGNHAFVMDFGIARKLQSEADEWTAARRDVGYSAGTPAYVSPEQAAGNRTIDQRSDVYSLACVAYEMLSGTTPFHGGSTQEIVSLRFRVPPPPLRFAAPDVPQPVADVIRRAMSLDPDQRPDSVLALITELRTAAAQSSRIATALAVTATRTLSRLRSRLGIEGPTQLRWPLERTVRDITFAARMLRKTPFVTAVAVASLALGIGANAAIFSLFREVLLQPLPVPDPARLVNFAAPGPKPGATMCNQAGGCDDVFSYPMYRDLERQQTSFTGIAAHASFSASVVANNEPSATRGLVVSGSYFPVLGITPAIGRLLSPAEDAVIGANPVTVLSYEFWQTRFGGRSDVVGQVVRVNGRSLTVVGVAAKGFTGTTLGARASLFVPLTMREVVEDRPPSFANRRSYSLYLFGRLKPSVTVAEASTVLNALYRRILADVEAPLQQGMSDQTMALFKSRRVELSAGERGQSSLRQDAASPMMILFSVTGVVLLIACANIANLLLMRGAGRGKEMGVRLALGASRRRLIAQLLTESLLLASLGGAASLLVAQWTLRGIGALLPPNLGASFTLGLQWPALLFSAALSVATGLLFGLFPALYSTRADLMTVIRASAGQVAVGRAAARFRSALVTAQIALSMALLVTALLFLRSLVNLNRVDLGAQIEQVVTFSVSPARLGYDNARSAATFDQIERALRATPGVTAVAASVVPLLSGNFWGSEAFVQGYPTGTDVDRYTAVNEVSAGYLRALSMPLIAGREFSESDRVGAARVAIVNETFAKKFNLGRGAVGTFLSDHRPDSLDIQIVGVVKDAKYSRVKEKIPPLILMPWRQDPRLGDLVFYAKTTIPPQRLLREIPALVKRIDAMLPVEDLKTVPQQIRENVYLDRMVSLTAAAFAVLATFLAGIGLYGVLAYAVAQRTREFGIRMAIGADGARIRGLVIRQVLRMLVAGAAIGIVTAFGVSRTAQSLLYQLDGHDPATFALAVALLSVVALAAGYVPARRATHVDPMQALRGD